VSIRSLTTKVNNDLHQDAIARVWFNGDKLRVLSHVRTLKRELKLLGFEEGFAGWVDRKVRGVVVVERELEGEKRKEQKACLSFSSLLSVSLLYLAVMLVFA